MRWPVSLVAVAALQLWGLPPPADGAERPSWCPSPWPLPRCLPSSGQMVTGPQAMPPKAPVRRASGLAGHSHYPLPPAPGAAVVVIGPQMAFAACPAVLTQEGLLAGPGTPGYAGHSPFCCEKFFPSVANINRLTRQARAVGYPVFIINHVYRDFDGDGRVDNCGRLCDFDPLGWAGWPEAWQLWSAAQPWAAPVYRTEAEPRGLEADFERDYYAEKSIYSAFTLPVVQQLRELRVQHVVLTGFATQDGVATSARVASDLGFRVSVATDAIDGPLLQQLLSGVDENVVIPYYLGVAVADTLSTADLLMRMQGSEDDANDEF